MKSIKEFFKNRVSFTFIEESTSLLNNRDKEKTYKSNVFKPEDYNIDFLRKIIPFCYYMFSDLGANKCKYIKWERFNIKLASFANKNDEDEDDIRRQDVTFCNTRLNDDCRFLWSVNSIIDKMKLEEFHIIPSKPFWFELTIYINVVNKEQIVNVGQTFKSDECIICLTKEPNILFCNCGHLYLCVEYDEKHNINNCSDVRYILHDNVPTSTCPVCKTKTTIKRTIEY